MNKLVPISEQYRDFIQGLQLVNVITCRSDFQLHEGVKLPVSEYKAQIRRSVGEIELNDTHLSLTIGFQIIGNQHEKTVFESHVHYLIVFSHTDRPSLEAHLADNSVKEMFCGAQADKLVWPNLRHTLTHMLLDAGLPPVTLPLLK